MRGRILSATGRVRQLLLGPFADLVPALARAAVAVGCDGLMIEVHGNPKRALSDGAQQLTPAIFGGMMAMLRPFAVLMGRKMG